MTYIKWFLIIVFWLIAGMFLHYTLPQFDVARVTDTEVRRIDPGENRWFWAQADAGSDGSLPNRDVFFISTVQPDGDVMVYRNEDTSWGWPPYFKFDTANLQAEASNVTSTAADPQWVAIRHYGWRNEFITIFPNAISIRPVDGPDARVIPWITIVTLVLLALVVWAIWVRWRRFRTNRIDPALARAGDRFEATGDSIAERRGRFSDWLGTWRSK